MKRLVITRADGNIKWYTDFTHPILRRYADKYDADFLILDGESPCNVGDGRYHYRIMKCKELFKHYEKILHLDSDIIIRDDCPDLFEHDEIATVCEDTGSRLDHRLSVIADINKKWGKIDWTASYINTGVIMFPKKCIDIFEPVNGKYWTGFGFDDVHLAYQAVRTGNNVLYNLSFHYNHMSMFSEKWNGYASRHESYIIHYAGRFNFSDRDGRDKLQIMKDDMKVWGQ